MTLAETIRSTYDPKCIYGICGDEVDVISDHGNVLVVEGKNGRFSVMATMVTDREINALPVATPEPIKREISITAPPLKRKLQDSQPKLF